jgi:hypothetical protein
MSATSIGRHTKHILQSGVKGTAGALVIRVVHKKVVNFAVGGIGHHIQFQVILQFSSRAMGGMKRPQIGKNGVAYVRNVSGGDRK